MDTRKADAGGISRRWATAPSAPLTGSWTTTRALATPGGSMNSRVMPRQPVAAPSPRRTSTRWFDSNARPVSRCVMLTLNPSLADCAAPCQVLRVELRRDHHPRRVLGSRLHHVHHRPQRDARDGVRRIECARHHRVERLARRRRALVLVLRVLFRRRRIAQRIPAAGSDLEARTRHLDGQLAPVAGALALRRVDAEQVVARDSAAIRVVAAPKSFVLRMLKPPVSSASVCVPAVTRLRSDSSPVKWP